MVIGEERAGKRKRAIGARGGVRLCGVMREDVGAVSKREHIRVITPGTRTDLWQGKEI
jgi:hypothetical protein